MKGNTMDARTRRIMMKEEIENGSLVWNADYGFAIVTDADHGGMTMEIEVRQTRNRTFRAIVWLDETRPATPHELREFPEWTPERAAAWKRIDDRRAEAALEAELAALGLNRFGGSL